MIILHKAVVTSFPDLKIHGAYMGPIWGWQDPGGPHVDPMNFAIWVANALEICHSYMEYTANALEILLSCV